MWQKIQWSDQHKHSYQCQLDRQTKQVELPTEIMDIAFEHESVQTGFRRQLREDLSKTFVRIANFEREFYRSNLFVSSISSYKEDIQKALLKTYTGVADYFSHELRDRLRLGGNLTQSKQFEDEEASLRVVDEEINDELERYLLVHSDQEASRIIDTADRRIHSYYNEGAEAAQQNSDPEANALLDPELIALLGTDFFLDYYDNHLDTITLTEVGTVAEASKLAEATAITAAGLLLLQKTWVSIRIETTRPWHRAAHGQTVPINDPYLVNGELLMTPKDDSLGASADNIINCYCSSVITPL